MRAALAIAFFGVFGAGDAGAASVESDLAPTCRGAIHGADYEVPTDRYAHGVLGDALEWGALRVRVSNTCSTNEPVRADVLITLPPELVFEDLAPRVVDVTGEGFAEVVVVESHVELGARLVVWGLDERRQMVRRAETPFIGQRFRWLAPAAVGDLDGDGFIEIAYVDRPHLAKTLRIWRYADGALNEVAQLTGVSNHRIGEDFISGGLRECGAGPEIVLVAGDWSRILSIRLIDGALVPEDIGRFSPRGLEQAMTC